MQRKYNDGFIVTSVLRKIKRGHVVIEGSEVPAKECSRCNNVYLLETYYVKEDMYDGHVNVCVDCKNELSQSWKKGNRSMVREHERKWRNANPDKVKEMAQRSHKKNAEGYNRRLREWKAINRDKVRVWDHQRRARVRGLPEDFDQSWMDQLSRIFIGGGCAVTGATDDIHWDHFIPLATGCGGTTYKNMVPLHSKVNLSKWANNPLHFFFQGEFEENRVLDMIEVLAFLNDMYIDEYLEYVNHCFPEDQQIFIEDLKPKFAQRRAEVDLFIKENNLMGVV